jgi:acetyl-CoA decarbonylase/synthase complex subunit gamma
VNVWCSAGKGTFCAEEIAKQVKASGLEKIVTHRNLILPQLSAPGVAANKLRELSGFRGIFGPVEARDVKKFIANGMKTEKYMREVQFGLLRRIETSWLEISTAFVPAVIASAALFAVSGWSNKGFSFEKAAGTGGIYILGILFALFAGTIIFSAVLPYIRSRYFSAKGAMLGALSAVILLALASAKAGSVNVLAVIALVSGAASISSFLALNYTGSTTFTSISGAKQEVKFSMPLIIAGLAISSIMAAADIILRSIK